MAIHPACLGYCSWRLKLRAPPFIFQTCFCLLAAERCEGEA